MYRRVLWQARALEVHRLGQDVAQRVEVQRVELVGRELAADELRGLLPGGGELLQPGVVRADPVTQRTGFKMVERRGFGHALPEPGEAGARAFATAFHQPGGQGHGVHGARAGAADGGDLQ